MKRSLLVLVALLVALPASAQKLDLGLQSSIVYQAIKQSNDNGSVAKLAPGFQNAVGNVTLRAELFPGGLVATDFFLSSKHHEEMYGYQGYFQLSQLPSWMKLGGFNGFFAEHLEVKAGQFTIGYGDGHLYQSVNGDVVNNELVGNAVVRSAATSLGAEGTLKFGPASLLAGFSNGTTSGTTEVGKGIALHGKLTFAPLQDQLRVSLSGYKVDHSANGTGYPVGGTKSYLYQGGDRAGSRYNVFGSDDGGEMFLGKGQDETALQLDARAKFGPVLVYGFAGRVIDNDVNGTLPGPDAAYGTADDLDNGDPRDSWDFYMATAKFNVTDWLYLAGRYSAAAPSEIASVDVDGKVQRFQVGAGFQLYKGVVLKAEYVNHTTSGFPALINDKAYSNGGTNLGLSPKFNGFVFETAVSL